MSVTFDQLCRDVCATPAERDDMAWHLAQFRARKTYEALRATAQAHVAHKRKTK